MSKNLAQPLLKRNRMIKMIALCVYKGGLMKKIIFAVCLFFSVSASASSYDSVLSDMQNLWISACGKSFSKSILGSYDPITGFNLAMFSQSPVAYKAAIDASYRSANKENCSDPKRWLEGVKSMLRGGVK
jgi:hypothetical protein